MVGGSKDDVDDGTHSETHQLDLLTTHLFHERDREPVSWDRTAQGDDDVTDDLGMDDIVRGRVLVGFEADRVDDDRVV